MTNKYDYLVESARRTAQFKAELFAKHKVANNPKAERAFEIAWEAGHAHGYHEVASYFEELVELIK